MLEKSHADFYCQDRAKASSICASLILPFFTNSPICFEMSRLAISTLTPAEMAR